MSFAENWLHLAQRGRGEWRRGSLLRDVAVDKDVPRH